MFHFSEHIFHNMKVPNQLRLQQRGGQEDMEPCKHLGVFNFQWQKPALACEAADVAKLVHALVLWHITCTKGVSSQKEPKGCTLPKDWNLWEFDTTRQYEGDPQPSSPRTCFLQRLSSFKLLPTSWPKRPCEWEIVIQVFSNDSQPC